MDGFQRGGDADAAAAGHGVPGIDREIHGDLFQHAAVGMDGGNGALRDKFDLHVLADDAFQHLDRVAHGIVEIQVPELHHLLAAEHEQLADERGGAGGGAGDLRKRFSARVGGLDLVLQQARVTLDDGEDVVEIVGDAGGQLADGLHLLGLAKLAFHQGTLGDVLGQQQRVGFSAEGDGGEGHEHFAQDAGLVADIALPVPDQFLAQQAVIPLIGQGGFFPEEQFRGGAADDFFGFVTGDFGKALVHVHETLVGKALDAAGSRAFVKRLGEALLGRRQLFIELFQLQYMQAGLEIELPLFSQGVGQLLHLHVVERLFQHQQAVRLADLGAHLLPGIIRVSGADDDLKFRIDLPDAGDGFHAVPAGRHAHIDEGHRVRPLVGQGFFHHRQSLLSLKGGIQFETDLFGRLLFVKQRRFEVPPGGSPGGAGAQDVAEILMNARIVVDDQDAAVGL